jgi:hypothetical protein
MNMDHVVRCMETGAGLKRLAQVACGQFDRICLGVAVIEQSRRSVDSEMVVQGATVEIFAGQTDTVPSRNLPSEAAGVEHVAGQIK